MSDSKKNSLFSNPPEQDIPLPVSIGLMSVFDGISWMVKEGIICMDEYQAGKIDQGEFIDRVYKKGTLGGGRTGAALSIKEGARVMTNKLGSEFLKKLARSNGATAVAFGLVDQGLDTYKWKTGEINEVQYKVASVKNIGTTSGVITGASLGAFIGSAIPGLGTLIGSMIGGMVGGMYGGQGGESLGISMFGDGKDPENPSNDSDKPGPIDIEISE